MDIEKIKETLKANGIEEEKIDKIIADLAEEDKPDPSDEVVDDNQAEGKTEEDVPPAPSDDVVPDQDVPVVIEEGNPSEEGDVPPDGDVPPIPPTEEEVLPADVPPTEVPPQDVPPQLPPFDPTELIAKVDEAYSKIEELTKTIEGLDARNKSLEDALAKAGVLEPNNEESSIGVDGSVIPGSSSNGADSAFQSALAKLNHK